MRPGHQAALAASPRDMCFVCMRPSRVCHCDAIPSIDNQTEVLIAQHFRERSHPFNTARMVHRALQKSQLIIDYSENMERYNELIKPNAGLLYPSREAIDMGELSAESRPEQLILLDGTWSQAKRMYRHWPQLASLPHYKIKPDSPGQYRIRLEPNDFSLSTVEATVAALQCLAPGTCGLDELLAAFETMVDRQLAHPQADYTSSTSPRRPAFNVPSTLLTSDNLVVAYGEAAPIAKGSPRQFARTPVFWVAQRFGSNETFHTAIESSTNVDNDLLEYFDLAPEHFSKPATAASFRQHWNTFLRPTDQLVVYGMGSLRLLNALDVPTEHAIQLRSVNYDPAKGFATLGSYLESCNVTPTPTSLPGRAGRRLANLVALIKCFRIKKSQENSTRVD